MTDRKFKAPDGNVYDESFLIEKYGQEEFDSFISDNSLEEVSTSEEPVLDEDEFTAPDGKKYSKSFLVERYGQEQFDSFVNDGSLKKKMLQIQTLRLAFQNFKDLIPYLKLHKKQRVIS